MSLALRSRRRVVAVMAAVLLTTGLAACGGADQPTRAITPAPVVGTEGEGFNGTLVDPPLRPAEVVLHDTGGATVDLSRPDPDKVTALFFGFTNCDDVCPTTMADLAAARRSLPPALAKQVIVRFVTVDPRRDTPAVLERWLNQFDQDFVGLRGPTELVNQAERSLYIPESGEESPAPDHDHTASSPADHHAGGQHESPSDGADYEVAHSGSVYVFGPGDRLLLYTGGTTPQQYGKDFRRLLTS
jgi:protein SCO1